MAKIKGIVKPILLVLLYYVMQALAGLAYGIQLGIKNAGKMTPEEMQLIINQNILTIVFISIVFTLIIFFLMYRKKEQTLFELCSFKKLSVNNSILILICAACISFFSSSFVMYTSRFFESYSRVGEMISGAKTSIIGTLSMIIIVPIFEEILFRGIALHELRKAFSLKASIIISAIIFGLAHGNPLQSIYTVVLGIFLALVYINTKSIFSCILLHIVYNLCGSIVAPLVLSLMPQLAVLFLILGLTLAVFVVRKIETKEEFNLSL